MPSCHLSAEIESCSDSAIPNLFELRAYLLMLWTLVQSIFTNLYSYSNGFLLMKWTGQLILEVGGY